MAASKKNTQVLPVLPTVLPVIEPAEQRRIDRKRRQLELGIAAGVFVLMLVMIFIQLQYFNSGSAMFFALFNLNVILLIIILFIVLRNGMKLLLERRRRIIGSRLRTRLVLAITGMTLIPCLIMFFVTAQFVKLSVDFWFKNQIEVSMETALEVARTVYNSTGRRLHAEAEASMVEMRPLFSEPTGVEMINFLDKKRKEYRLSLIGILNNDKFEINWHPSSKVGNSWQKVKEGINWAELNSEGYRFFIGEGVASDFMFGVLALDEGRNGYLVLGEDLGLGFQTKLARIASGAGEYKQLRALKRPLKGMLYITLTVMTGLITLSIIWFAFKQAKELTMPIMALVRAADSIAKGDLSVRLDDSATDEFGVLVKSFNRMAEDLGENRQELTETNALLAQQNLVLGEQRSYVEAVLDNIAAGVISFDFNWEVTTANKAACEILDRPLEQLLGQSVSNIFPMLEMDELSKAGNKLFRRQNIHVQQHFKIIKSGEERNLQVNAVGLPTADGRMQGAVAVFEDVTEMEKMQRLAAWREVARRIAHEIKNPLTPIKLSAQRLEKKFGKDISDPAFKESTRLIVRQVEQLQAMVQEFSAFAKMPEIALQRGDILKTLQDAVTIFRNSHHQVKLELELPQSLPSLEMDNDAMTRVFMNIFTNAVEAIETLDEPVISVKVHPESELNLLRIEIADNGPDLLTEEERNRLFEPYFSRKKSGTGLGLTIVRSIITEHHGYVRAIRNVAGGTTILIELPLT